MSVIEWRYISIRDNVVEEIRSRCCWVAEICDLYTCWAAAKYRWPGSNCMAHEVYGYVDSQPLKPLRCHLRRFLEAIHEVLHSRGNAFLVGIAWADGDGVDLEPLPVMCAQGIQ